MFPSGNPTWLKVILAVRCSGQLTLRDISFCHRCVRALFAFLSVSLHLNKKCCFSCKHLCVWVWIGSLLGNWILLCFSHFLFSIPCPLHLVFSICTCIHYVLELPKALWLTWHCPWHNMKLSFKYFLCKTVFKMCKMKLLH